ncbi:MAG TPA: hypothetical protein VFM10_01235 [Terriglobales bacterium]|jgi:hypothetical protein|nr:hypothetical protein [Terriglobales bacterium]
MNNLQEKARDFVVLLRGGTRGTLAGAEHGTESLSVLAARFNGL